MKKRQSFINKILVISSVLALIISLLLVLKNPIVGGRLLDSVLSIFIEGSSTITIIEPQNITYNFTTNVPLTLNLTVSSNALIDVWSYSLIDMRHNAVVQDNVAFTPNTTFTAVRWNNKIIVNGTLSGGGTLGRTVEFFVFIPNSAPIFRNLSDTLLACEGQSASMVFFMHDVDEDDLSTDIVPKDPLFVTSPTRFNVTDESAYIYAGTPAKKDIGVYHENVSVTDGQYADTKSVNITIIETNNAPTMDTVGVQTIYSQGDNSTLYKEVNVTDIESGNRTSGNFTFNLTFLSGTPFFSISNFGIINVSGNSSLVGVYNLSLCVTDQALKNIHQNISYCGQTGLNMTSCQNFSLTVTNSNRPPTIIDHYPQGLLFNAVSNDTLYFNITKYDPDGTIPDSYWYIDGSLNSYFSGSSVDNLTYSFGCGASGNHTVKAEITDGLANDSIQWNITLKSSTCPSGGGGGGGGGGGAGGSSSGKICTPQWACNDWNVCQEKQRSLEIGLLSQQDFRNIQDICQSKSLPGIDCGFQIRNCVDLNQCNTTTSKPEQIKDCIYITSPSCTDGIKNCHDNSCELLVDCGGSCGACPTCSDNKQNQGEQGIDCGGPCPWECKPETPLSKKISIYVVLFLILLGIFLLILLLIMLWRLRKLKKDLKKGNE